MSLDGKDLNGKNGRENPEGNKTEEQKTDEHKIEEQVEKQAVEEQIREMADDVEIPESLKPENIEKMLTEKGGKKPFRWKAAYSAVAAAACCVIVVGIAAFGGGLGGHKDMSNTESTSAADAGGTNEAKADAESSGTSDTVIASAGDYDEIYKYIEAEKKSQEELQKQYSVDSAADGSASNFARTESAESKADTSAAGAADSGASYSDTNIREEGVEEGDIVKTDGKNLYILNGQKVQIVNIENKEMKEMASIRLEDDQYISEIYIKGDNLLIVYTKTEYNDGNEGYDGTYKQYTVAETYDVSNPEKPKSVGKITQSGSFYTVRVTGDYVYLFSNFNAELSAARNDIDLYIPQVQGKAIDSGSILLPQYVRGNQYTVISAFSLKDPGRKLDSKAVFGSSGLVYVSGSSIYVCESYYNSEESDVTQTCIRKVAYKDGTLEAVGQTRIDGTLNDSFSIDEYEGNLRLVTTVSPTGGASPFPIVTFGESPFSSKSTKKDSNSLYVLNEKLNELGKIEGLAEDEQVYSARFMGSTGYFVTFKQVDPLFSVDLSNPEKPEVIGALKIPGFSDYLHPYGDGLLLGIGMDVDETGTTTEGVKLSMFDISDPSDVKEIEKYVMEDCYSTNVSYNYKAALINTDRNLIGFAAYGQSQKYYLFSYDKEKGFQCIFERELSGYSEGRGLFSEDTFYLVAGNTVESFRMDTFEKVDDIVL